LSLLPHSLKPPYKIFGRTSNKRHYQDYSG
jgi:hypothetical protein